MSTFGSLEVAKRGMNAAQAAISVVGNNINNANRPGYSRQRVDLVAGAAFPPVSMNRPQIPGQMGTGVEVGSITRSRDRLLDVQFRKDNNSLNFYNSRAEALSRMEDILNEPSSTGLSKVMDEFWKSLQDLSVNPSDTAARATVIQRANALAETFNYLNSGLESIKSDIKLNMETGVGEMNSILTRLKQINEQIGAVEPNGYLPNDLYDERDMLLDQLSNYLPIEVENV
ncbi:MAG: flagellar hook-associated protein FlgK, partial [Bacilli bacterium]